MSATTTLPQNLKVRRPAIEDAGAVADVMAASDIALQGTPDYGAEDVRDDWHRHGFDLQADGWLATTPAGQVVGYAGFWHERPERMYVEACVHPSYEGRGIGAFLLSETERRAHERLRKAPDVACVTLGQGIHCRNEPARRLLVGAGYSQVRTFLQMHIALESAPSPQWPAGVAVRTFVPDADDRAVWAADDEAFQDHWDHASEPFEQWRHDSLLREGFDPSLWFLALDGDEIAGFALCGYRIGIGSGWVDTLGVRRPWRGRGLGLALLHYAFGEFYRRGIRAVGLGVDAQSLTGATRLYERAGMYVERQYDYYTKELCAPNPVSP